MDTVFVEKGLQKLAQFEAYGNVLGVFVSGIILALVGMWVKSWKAKSKEDLTIIEKLTDAHAVAVETRDAVKDLKVDINNIKDKLGNLDTRLTGLETEHKMYSNFCFKKSDKMKEIKYVRVLIVDDVQENCDNMNDYFHDRLPKISGWSQYVFHIDAVNTYKDAVDKLERNNNYSLGIFDYRLSDNKKENGFNLLKICKNQGYLKNGNSLIVYSADDDLVDIPKGFANNFVLKPEHGKSWNIFEEKIKAIIQTAE